MFSYNSQDEMTREQSTRNGGYTDTFGFDPAFNPTAWKGSAQTFNADNQNSGMTFDGNGNPTANKGNTLGWDPENRLTSYGTLLTAGYNGDGLRAWKQNRSGARSYFPVKRL